MPPRLLSRIAGAAAAASVSILASYTVPSIVTRLAAATPVAATTPVERPGLSTGAPVPGASSPGGFIVGTGATPAAAVTVIPATARLTAASLRPATTTTMVTLSSRSTSTSASPSKASTTTTLSSATRVSAASVTSPAATLLAGGLTVAQVRSDADWIVSAQLPDGAIAFYPHGDHIWPYIANQAASGLARAASLTGDTAYASAAWAQLRWYAAHEGADGYVTDYTVSNGAETSTGTEDSTDAYAGTFLSAVSATWAADPVPSQLAGLHAALTGAVRAITSTQDTDGLTWAKPTWHVKYLMDQAETYAGLQAVGPLATILGDASLEATASSSATRMRSGVAALWNSSLGAYNWALHSDGVQQPTNWANLYSDAMEQAWAAGYGLTSSSRAQALAAAVQRTHPEWDQPATLALINGVRGPAGYWPAAGFALTSAGETAQAATAAQSIQAGADGSNRAWPFTPADAGNLIVLASGGPGA